MHANSVFCVRFAEFDFCVCVTLSWLQPPKRTISAVLIAHIQFICFDVLLPHHDNRATTQQRAKTHVKQKIVSIQTKMSAFKSIVKLGNVQRNFFGNVPVCFHFICDIINGCFFLLVRLEQGNQMHRRAYNCTYISIDELANCSKNKMWKWINSIKWNSRISVTMLVHIKNMRVHLFIFYFFIFQSIERS